MKTLYFIFVAVVLDVIACCAVAFFQTLWEDWKRERDLKKHFYGGEYGKRN